MKKDLAGIVVIVATAFVLAVVTNAVAGRERKLLLGGFYPDPFKVPGGQQRPAPKPVASADGPTVTPMTSTAAWVTGTVESTVTATPTVTAAPTSAPASTVMTSTAVAKATPVPPATMKASPPAIATPEPAVDLTAKFPPHPDQAYLEVGWNEVALLHRRGALFLDARRSSVFQEGHVAGSRPFSVWESDVDDKVNALFGERSSAEQQAQPIVIYCSGGACEDSHMLAQKLWGAQFNNVLVYKDGYPDWVKRGGATRAGK